MYLSRNDIFIVAPLRATGFSGHSAQHFAICLYLYCKLLVPAAFPRRHGARDSHSEDLERINAGNQSRARANSIVVIESSSLAGARD